MKTYKNLYPRIYAWDTLEAAYRKARKGKRGYAPAADFEYRCQPYVIPTEGRNPPDG